MTPDLDTPDLGPAEAELRRSLRSELDALPVPAAPDSFADQSSAGRGAGVDRRVLIGAAAASAAGVAVAWAWWIGAGRAPAPPAAPTTRPTRPRTPGAWAALPDLPLTPRAGMLGVRVGGHVVVLGGDIETPCPPNAACVGPTDVPNDGAILDLATRTWRRFEHPVPDPLTPSQYPPAPPPSVYRLIAAGERAVFVSAGAWYALEPETATVRAISGAPADEGLPMTSDGRLVYGVRGTDEDYSRDGEVDEDGNFIELPTLPPARVHALDLESGRWDELPQDPLGPSYDRQVVWTDAGLVVLSKALVADPGGASGPSFVRAAVYADGRWGRLPDLDCIGGWRWHWTGRRLVSPDLGGADGGETNGYGRVIPYHGWLDPVSGESGPLADQPDPQAEPDGARFSAESEAAADGPLMLVHRWLYDDDAGTWTRLEEPPGGQWVNQVGALVATTDESSLIVAGGYDEADEYQSAEGLTARAWRLPL